MEKDSHLSRAKLRYSRSVDDKLMSKVKEGLALSLPFEAEEIEEVHSDLFLNKQATFDLAELLPSYLPPLIAIILTSASVTIATSMLNKLGEDLYNMLKTTSKKVLGEKNRLVIKKETRMRPLTPQRWKATIDMLVLVSILTSLVQSLVTNSDQPAERTLAVVGLAWAMTTGISYWGRLLGAGKGKPPGDPRKLPQRRLQRIAEEWALAKQEQAASTWDDAFQRGVEQEADEYAWLAIAYL